MNRRASFSFRGIISRYNRALRLSIKKCKLEFLRIRFKPPHKPISATILEGKRLFAQVFFQQSLYLLYGQRGFNVEFFLCACQFSSPLSTVIVFRKYCLCKSIIIVNHHQVEFFYDNFDQITRLSYFFRVDRL